MNEFTFEEVAEIDPKNNKIMLWNHQIYEYDYLVLANGYNIFWNDFGPEDAFNDIKLYNDYFEPQIQNNEELRNIVEQKAASLENNLSKKFVIYENHIISCE